jgi:hypothetical protein
MKIFKNQFKKGMIYCMTILNARTEKIWDKYDVEVWMLEFIPINTLLLNSLSVNIADKG